MRSVQLNNGIRIPQLGVGVYMIDRADACRENVRQAELFRSVKWIDRIMYRWMKV